MGQAQLKGLEEENEGEPNIPSNAISAGNGWWFNEDYTELYGPRGVIIDGKLTKEEREEANAVMQEYREHPEHFIPFDEAMRELQDNKL